MVSIIYGKKGSGKTKKIIDAANSASEHATGQIIFITDNTESLGIHSSVRFINISEHKMRNEYEFTGFLKGMLATNFDIQKVYIDSISRLLDKPAEELQGVLKQLALMAEMAGNVDFIAAVTTDKLPEFMKPYVKED